MGAAHYSKVNYNPFEQALSSDVNRMQQLASREQQDVLRLWGATDPDINTSTGALLADNSVDPLPIVGADRLPRIVSRGTSNFVVTYGAGQAYAEQIAAVGADDSKFAIYRWIDTTLTHAAPDGTNPRIDLIVAAPAAVVAADPLLRNILLDPVARTVAQQTVNKTQNPLVTLSIVQGTPAATPTAPYSSVASDGLVLFEVFVPAAVAGAVSFNMTRQLHKRVAYPLSSFHGVILGCQLFWTSVDEAVGDSKPNLFNDGVSGFSLHRAVIDGELLHYGGNDSSIRTENDTANNPFSTPAPTLSDAPFYVYLVGGRRLRVGTKTALASALGFPFMIVYSATAPLADGRPSASLTTTFGTVQAGALYIGVGFKVRNSTRSKPCWQDGDWVFAKTGTTNPFTGPGLISFNEPLPTVGTVDVAVNWSSIPRFTSAARMGFAAVKTSGTIPFELRIFGNELPTGTKPELARIALFVATGSVAQHAFRDIFIPRGSSGATTVAFVGGVTAGQEGFITTHVWPIGYNMNVPRLSP